MISRQEKPAKTHPLAPPALLSDEQAAAFLGISVRKFHEIRAEPWMPRPIALGPRLLRWARGELESAIAAMPRQGGPTTEPEHLQRGREARRVIVRSGRIVKEVADVAGRPLGSEAGRRHTTVSDPG